MVDFVDAYNRWQSVVFSVLACAVVLVGTLLFRKDSLSLGSVAAVLSLMGVSILYFVLGRSRHVPQRARYLLRTVPVLFLMALIGGLLLIGFIVYLMGASDPLRMTGTTTLEGLPRMIILILLLLGLLLPLFVVFASRDVMLSLRSHHQINQRTVRFFTKRKEWVVAPGEYTTIVLGENVVFACKGEEEVAQATRFINRPLEQSLLARPLDGVHYINTESLVDDLRRNGFLMSSDRRAIIARFS